MSLKIDNLSGPALVALGEMAGEVAAAKQAAGDYVAEVAAGRTATGRIGRKTNLSAEIRLNPTIEF